MQKDPAPETKRFFYLSMALIAVITLYPMFTTGFATADDLLYYMAARRGPGIGDLRALANNAGRFYLYLTGPFYFLPYLIDHPFAIKLFHFIPMMLCFILFARIIAKATGSGWTGWLFLLLFLQLMQLSGQTNLFASYPFYFSFSFLLLLSSFRMLQVYLERPGRRILIGSALMFLAGLLFYETYLFYIVFAFLLILKHHVNESGYTRKTFRQVLAGMTPFLVAAAGYITAYLVFRYYHPSPYAGSTLTVPEGGVSTFFLVIWRLAFTSFPMTVFETSRTFFESRAQTAAGHSPVVFHLIAGAKVAWIVKGVLAAFCGWIILQRVNTVRWKALLHYSLAAVLLIFLPHLLLALTGKYSYYVEKEGMIGYVTTFFSFFGVLLLLVVLLSCLVNSIPFGRILRPVLTLLILGGLFIASVLTDYSNEAYAKDIRSANLRLYAVDDLCRSGALSIIPPGTPVFGKSLWDNPSMAAAVITEEGFSWSRYFALRGKDGLQIERDVQAFRKAAAASGLTPWYLGLRQAVKTDDVTLVAAPLEDSQCTGVQEQWCARRACIFFYSPLKKFTVSFRVPETGTNGDSLAIGINHIRARIPGGKTTRITIENKRMGEKATGFMLEAPAIDLNSVMISGLPDEQSSFLIR